MKKIAILQSNYIPWKGYFDIIDSVDEFVFYDEVQYTKNDWRNRNRVKSQNGVQWLTIPARRSQHQTIRETKIVRSNWNVKHWKCLSQNYSKARCFRETRDFVESLYMQRQSSYLSEVNIAFIKLICEYLGITTKLTLSTDYEKQGDRNEKLVSLCK